MTKTVKTIMAILATTFFTTTYASSVSKVGASAETNERVQYAYDISGGNMTFLATIEAENSQWTTERRSTMGYYRNGKKWYDYGICQISQYYHPKIVNDNRFFSDWKFQIENCWKLYKGGTKFYGKKNAWKTVKRFIITE